MRIAWFAPAVSGLDDIASLIAELRAHHEIVRYDAASAHDFVWQHARRPFDLPVYELSDTPEAAFVWPYLLHHPGLLRLRDASLRASRGGALLRARRRGDYEAELRISRRMLRVPLVASRMAVVPDASSARALREEHPDIEVAHAPVCVAEVPPTELPDRVTFGIYDASTSEPVRRAADRARAAGSAFELRECPSDEEAVRGSHVVFAMRWPSPAAPPVAALAAMSAARVAIVHEAEATAGWPALDPQTWVPRSLTGGDRPIVVSVDPRDEEHSLMLSIRRLAADRPLREALGRAAQAWWRAHATPAIAAAAWEPLLRRAAGLSAPPRPAGWPAHLTADGTSSARTILDEFGIAVDFL